MTFSLQYNWIVLLLFCITILSPNLRVTCRVHKRVYESYTATANHLYWQMKLAEIHNFGQVW